MVYTSNPWQVWRYPANYAPVAQGTEHRPSKPSVVGSIPTGRARNFLQKPIDKLKELWYNPKRKEVTTQN